ncbi:tripartite tricarboxylate transporter TctB family protein [Paenibacillus turpanensis]|uniref:tripartite tricarboxylate transporter TctB family protein n=1 Tax=Paenibacillus turpanensis TaxID=2689078 RepID=UPI00140CD5A7|nr:tripartite tricarboxylate transporter TctB family protein [Paenibacillus turpanensis]
MKLKNNLSFYLSLVLMIFAGTFLWQSWELDYYSSLGPGPGLFPRWLSGGLLLISIWYMVSSIGQPIHWSEVMPKGRDMRNVLTVLASVLVFVFVLSSLGFVLAGFLMMFSLLARSYPWLRASVIALSVNVLIYYTFSGWLDVPLPKGELWSWVG